MIDGEPLFGNCFGSSPSTLALGSYLINRRLLMLTPRSGFQNVQIMRSHGMIDGAILRCFACFR